MTLLCHPPTAQQQGDDIAPHAVTPVKLMPLLFQNALGYRRAICCVCTHPGPSAGCSGSAQPLSCRSLHPCARSSELPAVTPPRSTAFVTHENQEKGEEDQSLAGAARHTHTSGLHFKPPYQSDDALFPQTVRPSPPL